MNSVESPKNLMPRKFILVVAGWTLLVLLSLLFNMKREQEDTLNAATAAVRANITKDIGFRNWASSKGGVYVSPTEHTPPNPYLMVPERDVETLSGRALTLMNPAYMLREIQADFSKQFGVLSRITSLKPINPINAPDPWESKALAALEQGQHEVLELEQIDGEPYLRLMLPLQVEASCLKCHGHQGYRQGDIRGGIEASVPMKSYYQQQIGSYRELGLTHCLIWWVGFFGTGIFYRRENRLVLARLRADRLLVESEHKFRSLFETANDGIFLLDANRFVDCNQKGADLFGVSKQAILGSSLVDFAPERQPNGILSDDVAAERMVAALQGKPQRFEWRSRAADGNPLDLEISLSCVEFRGASCLQAIMRNITERKRIEQELRLRQFTLDRVNEQIFWIDQNARIIEANGYACQSLGYSREELLHMTVADIDPDFPLNNWPDHWRELRRRGVLRFESRQICRDGRIIPTAVVANFFEYNGKFYNCALVRDISVEKALLTKLEVQAHFDFLTKVCSRAHFLEQAEHELERSRRYNHPLSLLMLDVDNFKQINDRYGHKVGDDVLVKLAAVFRETLRHVDIAGRLGGEEFAILLPHTAADEAREVAERLRHDVELAQVPQERGMPLHITVSIGVVSRFSMADNLDMLLSWADQAMYQAKEGGRNRVCVARRGGGG